MRRGSLGRERSLRDEVIDQCQWKGDHVCLSVCVLRRVVIDMDVLLTSVGKSMISILNIHMLNTRPTHSKS